jgi:hypothetical protein
MGMCKVCRNNKYLYGEENKKKRNAIARKWREESPTHLLARRKRRIHAIVMLGGKCECCGELNLEFLAIDHVNGLSHRDRARDSGDGLLKRVRESGYSRKEFRVLCHNCNSSLGFYGYCPHQGHAQEFLTRKRVR